MPRSHRGATSPHLDLRMMNMESEQNNVKRFRKLGYSHSDIVRVLQTLQRDAQTNDILQELIKTCSTPSTGAPGAPDSSPKLIPRGCDNPVQHTTHTDTHCDSPSSSSFRPVVIDGSNVAISHGNKKVFSCRGIQLAVQWFWDRGIRDITVFVPLWRKEQSRPEAPITDQHILDELERRNILVFTPSRCVNGKRVVCYDDRYIIKLAHKSDGIIVSNDNYRDLQVENPQWKKFIEERLLMYTFANDIFMPPDDPLGRNGPTIENFLRKRPVMSENKQQHCPYGKKCTYGVKCKFYHPERANQPQLSVADELRAKSQPAEDFPPRHTANQPTICAPAHLNEFTRALSSINLYSVLPETQSPAYLQRSTHALCKSMKSDQAYGSLESSMSRLYLSDSALQTSLGYSSGCMAGSDSDYFLTNPDMKCRRSRTPDAPSRYHSAELHYPHTLYPNHGYHSQYSREPLPYPHLTQPAHYGLREASWGQEAAQIMDNEKLTDRRRDVRSQLSTIFPQSIIDQVMSLYPHILDTTELVMLIQKYRNSPLL